ncbi:MAG: tetratricopeptide repeat protein [Elusimicrobiota bacterium]
MLALLLALAVPAQGAWLEQGTAALFDLEFDKARAVCEGRIREAPTDPSGALCRAAATWWQAATEPVEGRVDAALEKRFFADVDAAFKLAKKGSGAQAHVMAGLALGLRAQWHQDRGEKGKAKSYGKKAAKRLKKALKLDPRASDAHFGLGVLDLEEGTYALRTAMGYGRLTSDAAAFFLLRVLILERKDYEAALPVLERLRGRYPRSLMLKFLEAVALHRVGRWDESRALLSGLLQDPAVRAEFLGPKQPRIVCGFYQERCLERETLLGAIEWTSREIETWHPKGLWRSVLLFYRGLAYGLAGDHDLAARDLRAVERHPELSPMSWAADTCASGICRRQTVLELMKELYGLQP